MLAPSPTVQVLQAARNLIADETRWCRSHMAHDADGCSTNPRGATAVSWCAHGAIEHELSDVLAINRLGSWLGSFLDKIAAELFPATVRDHPEVIPAAAVNDHLGHAAVMRLYTRAIELAAVDPRDTF